jgi:iron complex transport system substrate-binding protein
MLTGCGLFRKDEAVETPYDTEPEPFPVTIDNVVIEASPVSIVCLSPALTEILFEFEVGDRLIGRSSYCDYPLTSRDVEIVEAGVDFDVDSIIRLSPNLLLVSSSISEKDRIALEREGIATVAVPAPKSVEQFKNIYRIIGIILYGSFIGADEGEAVYSPITLALNNPEVVDLGDFVYITENMSIATGDTLEGSVLSCFGNNLAKEGSGYVFDKEELLKNQPDTIILSGIYSPKDLKEDEVFSQLKAFKKGRIIILNNAYFERPTARIITLISAMTASFNDLKSE